MQNSPMSVTDAQFSSTVVESELPFLVDFRAPCGGATKDPQQNPTREESGSRS